MENEIPKVGPDIASFSDVLLAWFDQHGRKNLPWQSDINAYRVWVSEIMLQQTQVKTVIDYFTRFMTRFPLVTDLAAASEDDVLHMWTGLGYYARARNLHKTAKLVSENYNGEFPATQAELEALPGIGRSTAGAILAIAHKTQATILDGNVKRVLARCYGVTGWPGQTAVANQMWDIADALTPEKRVADYTQAIMDMGATLCVRSKPACALCPFEATCYAAQNHAVAELPNKKPKKAIPVRETLMLMLENETGELLLHKRPSTGLWGGLWSFPEASEDNLAERLEELEADVTSVQRLTPFRHTFTHFHLDITPIQVKYSTAANKVSEANQSLWYDLNNPAEIGLTRPVTRLIADISKQLTQTQD